MVDKEANREKTLLSEKLQEKCMREFKHGCSNVSQKVAKCEIICYFWRLDAQNNANVQENMHFTI